MDTALESSNRVSRTGGAPAPGAGAAAILLGASLLVYVVLFATWLASTRVNIDGDPAAQPAMMAQQLINGAATPMWFFYLLLGAFSMIAVVTSTALARRVSSPTVAALGTAALAVLAVTMLLTAAVTERAGSATLPKAQLEQAIPVLFGVVIPALLGMFCLICALWTWTFSWLGWRSQSVPRWLCIVGVLTGVVMLVGVTGAPGVEVLVAPWLICAGIWTLRSRPEGGDTASAV